MKKTLMILAIASVFISCTQNENSSNTAVTGKDSTVNPPPSTSLDSTLIPLASADTLIYNYNEYLENIIHDSLSYSSFMLNANALREYLNSNPEIATLNIYLGKNDRGTMKETSMNLVYIGAIDSPGADGVTYNVEKPYYRSGDMSTPYFLNHSFPCPTCVDRIEAYKPPTTTSSNE